MRITPNRAARVIGIILIAAGATAIVAGLLLTPTTATRILSPDHHITPTDLRILDWVRLTAEVAGLLIAVLGIIWITIPDAGSKAEARLAWLHSRLVRPATVKWVLAGTFAAIGLVAFPYAVVTLENLYADGGGNAAILLQTGSIFHVGFPSRSFEHLLRGWEAALAIRAGVTNPRSIMYIYSLAVYYTPFLFYALAALMLVRKRKFTQAALLGLMWLVLIYFTSYYMDQETQMASALFAFTMAMLATVDLRKPVHLFLLIGIGVLSSKVYQFWVFYFPVCLAYLVFLLWKEKRTPWLIRILQGAVGATYLVGTVINIISAFSPGLSDLRGQLLNSLLHEIFVWVFASCLLFGLIVLVAGYGPWLVARLQLDQRFQSWRRLVLGGRLAIVIPVMAAGMLVLSFLLYYKHIPRPGDAYSFRILHLFLGLLWAASFAAPEQEATAQGMAPKIALAVILPMLILTMQASLYQTSRWFAFTKNIYAATRQHTGYVQSNQVKLNDRSFLWKWTEPSISILEQGLRGQDIKSIIYDPAESYKVYSPDDYLQAVELADKLQVKILFSDPESP